MASDISPLSPDQELLALKYALDQSAIVAITDERGVIIHVNDKFCEISQFNRDELIGQTHRVVNSGIHPQEFFVELWQTIAHGKIWEGDICNRKKSGEYYWVHTTIVPFRNNQGQIYQYVSIRYEITQTMLANERIRNYATKLEASNRELQDFASIAAHDLQEPLRKIRTFGERLVGKFLTDLPADAQDYLQRMNSAAIRMQALIEDLLRYSRITSRAKPLERVSISKTVECVLEDLEIPLQSTGAKITVDCQVETIFSDPTQLRQLFQNLVANALKFRKPNEQPMIQIWAKMLESGSVELGVQDNGIGIDSAYHDKIFTIFQRLHGRSEYEGTGVGLAICRRIAEQHNGRITVESSPGNGSCFRVILPPNDASISNRDS